MKIAVVTDSTAYLESEIIDKYDIKVVPIPFIFGSDVYNEGIDISTENFYTKLRSSKELPSTTQPPVGELIELYKSLGDQGYDAVISIHLASTISGLYQTLVNVKDEVKNIDVYPYDSQITVKLMGYLAVAAAKMADDGKNPEDIIEKLNDIRATINEYFIVDDLQNLVRGGRLSNAQAFIGSMLKIKPILTFDNESHKIVAFEKVRSSKRALKRVEALFADEFAKIDYPIRLIIIHANDEQAALDWKDKIHEAYPELPIDISYFGPVVGTHLGEKALALAWMYDVEKM